MSRQIIPLTDKKCKSAKSKDKVYKLFDGSGLYLEVRPSGKKYFRFKYKNKTYTIGEYPIVTLAEARNYVNKIKKQLYLGIDIRNKGLSLEEVVKEFLALKEQEWGDKHYKINKSRLEYYILPFLAKKEIKKIAKTDIIRTLKKIPNIKVPTVKKTDKNETTRRVYALLKQIYKYAVIHDYVDANILEKIDINEIVPKREEEHMKAILDEKEFKKMVKEIWALSNISIGAKLAFKFLILTALRQGNVRGLKWEWVDLDKRVIVYPKEAIKTREEYRLPLTDALIDIILQAKEIKLGEYVFFASDPNKQMSDTTFNMILRRLGYKNHTTHGFRSSFATFAYKYMHEHGFSDAVIETQLGHKIGNKVTRAYMRSDFLEERRKLLEWWEEFLGN